MRKITYTFLFQKIEERTRRMADIDGGRAIESKTKDDQFVGLTMDDGRCATWDDEDITR